MTWPTPQDYNEAVQNPRTSFRDAQLRDASPELTILGLPRPVTGNFASVYRMTANSGPLAVRCFFREFADIQQRYSAISAHLASSKLPYTVGFTYLHDGIAVKRTCYPILKMDWVDGQLLDEYIRDHYSDSNLMRELGSSCIRLASAMRTKSVAHGDLQHGNMIVRNGAIRLVDYDGMFVPALAGKTSHELGHPNYQHPGRSASFFDARLDNFSLWAIYLSVAALAIDPNLWTELGAGDERLLVGQSDFANPTTSPAFRTLLNHRFGEIRELAHTVRSFLDVSPTEVPQLTATPVGSNPQTRLRIPRHGRITVAVSPEAGRLPEWVAGYVPVQPLETFADPGPWPRLTLSVAVVVFATTWFPAVDVHLPATSLAALGVGEAATITALLAGFYLGDSRTRRRQSLRWIRSRFKLRLFRFDRKLRRLERKQDRIERAGQSKLDRVERVRDRAVARCAAWNDGIKTMVRDGMTPLTSTIDQLRQAETNELAALREAHREALLTAYLRHRKLHSARIRGLGWADKARLWMWGVRSAADVNALRVPALRRLGNKEAAALLRWHASVAADAQRDTPMPTSSPSESRIRATYLKRTQRVDRLRRQVLLDGSSVLSTVAKSSKSAEDRFIMRARILEEEAAKQRTDLEDCVCDIESRWATADSSLTSVENELSRLSRLTVARYLASIVLPAQRFKRNHTHSPAP